MTDLEDDGNCLDHHSISLVHFTVESELDVVVPGVGVHAELILQQEHELVVHGEINGGLKIQNVARTVHGPHPIIADTAIEELCMHMHILHAHTDFVYVSID